MTICQTHSYYLQINQCVLMKPFTSYLRNANTEFVIPYKGHLSTKQDIPIHNIEFQHFDPNHLKDRYNILLVIKHLKQGQSMCCVTGDSRLARLIKCSQCDCQIVCFTPRIALQELISERKLLKCSKCFAYLWCQDGSIMLHPLWISQQ